MTIALPYTQKGITLDKIKHRQGNTRQAAAEALAFLKESWNLSDGEIANYLRISRATVNKWLQDGSVPIESLSPPSPVAEAVLHLLAIHRSLFAMFTSSARQREWISAPHPELKAAPEELMQQSTEGLLLVRRYLDYVRGRGA